MIKIKQLRTTLIRPSRRSTGASGFDVYSSFGLTLLPGARELVPCGFAIEMPLGIEAQIRPRSGLALLNGVTVLNAPGTIDSDFRGEVCVLLANLGRKPVAIIAGDRIAQLVFARVELPEIELVEELSYTGRGSGGFGSTGSR